jgi:hypothetical protein
MALTAAKSTPTASGADQSFLKNFQTLRIELTNILHNKSSVIETTLCALISGGHELLTITITAHWTDHDDERNRDFEATG